MKKLITMAAMCCIVGEAQASEAKLESVKVATDAVAVERGVENLMNSCHACHSMKYIKYRDLVNFGINKQKVDGWRGVEALDSALLSQMSENDSIQAYGKAPPDLSLMAKARDGGTNYVYSYLLGYYAKPDGATGNHIYPETKMPDILGMSSASDEAQRTTIKEQARDIVSFLAWAADPHAQQRHQLGYYVLAYLFVLTVLLYLVKNQIWARLK